MNTELLKNSIVKLIVEEMLKALGKKITFLAWGPMPAIMKYILTKILMKAIELGLLELGVAMMKAKVNKQVEKIEKIAKKYENNNIDERNLNADLHSAYRDLFKFNIN